MDPADELIDLVTRGIPLAARYPEHDALVSARSRFVVPADLRHLARRATPRSNRPPLPLTPTTTDTGKRPRVAIATPNIIGPIRVAGCHYPDALDERSLQLAFHYRLSDAARAKARECSARAVVMLEEIRRTFVPSIEALHAWQSKRLERTAFALQKGWEPPNIPSG